MQYYKSDSQTYGTKITWPNVKFIFMCVIFSVTKSTLQRKSDWIIHFVVLWSMTWAVLNLPHCSICTIVLVCVHRRDPLLSAVCCFIHIESGCADCKAIWNKFRIYNWSKYKKWPPLTLYVWNQGSRVWKPQATVFWGGFTCKIQNVAVLTFFGQRAL